MRRIPAIITDTAEEEAEVETEIIIAKKEEAGAEMEKIIAGKEEAAFARAETATIIPGKETEKIQKRKKKRFPETSKNRILQALIIVTLILGSITRLKMETLNTPAHRVTFW